MEANQRELTPRINPRVHSLFELAICLLVYGLSRFLFEQPELGWTLGWNTVSVLMGIAFWTGVRLRPVSPDRSAWVLAIERTSTGLGLSLLLDTALVLLAGEPFAYVGWYPLPVYLVLLSGIVAGSLITLLSRLGARTDESVVLIGGQLASPLAEALGRHLIGVVDASADQVPAGLTFLGEPSQLERIVADRRPSRVVVAAPQAALLSDPLLTQWRLSGVAVEDDAAMYERLYLRVSSQALKPSDVLSSSPLAASPAMMSLQATYSNVIGLALLIPLSPLMLLLAICSRLAAGAGPILDRVECAGFEGIPFYRLRFRTRSARTGEITWVGKIVFALRLTGLPQLINLVRGEMAMFGPAPARLVFARHLEQVIPFYAHRLTMRPGVLGWAQTHLAAEQGLREEVLQLEFDLYYIKQCSPSLDLEILLRGLLRAPHTPRWSRRK